MTKAASSRTSRDRVKAYRERQRAKGLRPVTLWLPDLDDPKVRAEIRRQCALVGRGEDEREAQAWLDSLHDDYVRMLDDEEGCDGGGERLA